MTSLSGSSRRMADGRPRHFSRASKWCRAHHRRLLVLLSYDVPTVRDFLGKGTRFDQEFLPWLKRDGIEYRKGVFPFLANGRARTLGTTEGTVKRHLFRACRRLRELLGTD